MTNVFKHSRYSAALSKNLFQDSYKNNHNDDDNNTRIFDVSCVFMCWVSIFAKIAFFPWNICFSLPEFVYLDSCRIDLKNQ